MFESRSPEIRKPFKRDVPDAMLVSPPEGADLPVAETEVSVAQGNNNLQTVAESRAKRLLHRVQKGETLSQAAGAERMTVAELKDPDNPVRASVQQLIGSYFLPPEARKQMVRAGLNKMFVENVSSSDPMAQKVALDAAKQISLDPEVGLAQDQGGGVIINISELEGVFAQLKAIKAPKVEDGRQEENQTIEGEYEDITPGGDKSESVPDVLGGLSAGEQPEVVSSE